MTKRIYLNCASAVPIFYVPYSLCRTQAIVSDDLGMVNYAAYSTPKGEMKTRDIKVISIKL